ncbi:elongation factor G-like protein EF-G2 [Spongisporangium articulatum]|uniref:Elongation factor G-like protein EF-G2 n=1 Tax=Spongisporangium articulatum TaxID=3362603 RepID=A0ABW8ANA2_9ACTN
MAAHANQHGPHGPASDQVRHGPPAPESIRNVVLVGHAAAGKTTLVEALLTHAGVLTRPGRVEDGTTVCDAEAVEKRLGRSVTLSVASFAFDGRTVNLVDTPGHPDFVGDVRAGLRAGDAALFVVSAMDEVDGLTRALWQECAAVGLPSAVVVTHIDQQRGDFEQTLATCRRAFGDGVQPLYLPHDRGAGLRGLLSSSDPAVRSGPERAELIEAIIQESEDDTLLERWLSGDDVEYDTLVRDLERAVARGSFHPVLPAVPPSGVGAAELLELITRGFPSPLEHPLPAVTTPDGGPRAPVGCDPDGPLVAEVLRTTSDPYVGQLSLLRIFSGRIRTGDTVHVSGHLERWTGPDRRGQGHPDHDDDERAGAVSRALGQTLTPVGCGTAGDIVAVARLAGAATGDTLSDVGAPALLEPWSIPDPLLPAALSARTSAAEEKLSSALARLAGEDPAVRVHQDPATGQLVVWTMGEAHLEVFLDRLASRHGVDVELQPVRVALRETVRGAATGHGRHVKQSGGHGQYAVCDLEIEPLEPGSGFEFVDRVVGGAVPRQFIPSVEKGVRAQLLRGVAGYPMVDLRVTLVGGKAHSVDSSDAAFAAAGALALREAAEHAGVALLEPVDAVEIEVDDEYVGAVLGDLSSRRARVTGTAPAGPGRTLVSGEVPALELTAYAPALRGLAHGTGTFRRAYARHAPMPPAVADRVLAPA